MAWRLRSPGSGVRYLRQSRRLGVCCPLKGADRKRGNDPTERQHSTTQPPTAVNCLPEAGGVVARTIDVAKNARRNTASWNLFSLPSPPPQVIIPIGVQRSVTGGEPGIGESGCDRELSFSVMR